MGAIEQHWTLPIDKALRGQEEVDEDFVNVTPDGATVALPGHAGRKERAPTLPVPAGLMRGLRHDRIAGRTARLATVVRVAVLRPRPSQIVEEDPTVVRAPIEENRTTAYGTMCVRVHVAIHRPAAVARPAERRRRVVQGEMRNAFWAGAVHPLPPPPVSPPKPQSQS